MTAASLFDGHDAAIHIMRRLLQAQGAEVIHLGHDRSARDVVEAAVQEDAQALALSSYQGGHLEYFRYVVSLLEERGASHIRVYGGGGGTITPDEARSLERDGVARIFGPEDGRRLGLEGMIRLILDECRTTPLPDPEPGLAALEAGRPVEAIALAGLVSWLEERGEEGGPEVDSVRSRLDALAPTRPAPVVGITGTGGAGKSSLVDELLRRLRRDAPGARIGLVLVDPTRRRSGGALLGDRIRLNAAGGEGVFVRSLATRQAHLALSRAVGDTLRVLRAGGCDLLLVETAGIGQSDSEVVELADLSLYVMTPEYGAPSQLEKIDMIDLADVVVLNKFDRQGAPDALRDVRKQWRRNRARFDAQNEEVPVYPAVARLWNDPGTERVYEALRRRVVDAGGRAFAGPDREIEGEIAASPLIPVARARYLAEIAEAVRAHHAETGRRAEAAAATQALGRALEALGDPAPPGHWPAATPPTPADAAADEALREALRGRHSRAWESLPEETREALAAWPGRLRAYRAPRQRYAVRGREIEVENQVETLSGTSLPRVAPPASDDWGEVVRFLGRENLPGHFPYTGGVFPFKRAEEDPARMFAGEGDPERTNRRFHYLSRGQPAKRLSTAFDSVTLYGRDPAEQPDVYGKVGTSGVSVCTLDDAKKLYSGFDLCDPATSVSMTINGPAPTVLGFFLNTAIDQQVERHLRETGGLAAVRERFGGDAALPRYAGTLPEGHDGFGLGLLGIPGDRAVEPGTYEQIRDDVLRRVRGTVQADILKEDQAQNTCIFSTEFSLGLMGDVQEYFCRKGVRNFYSVSISGYHMAEAGASPISQLAFTLANGFTYVEAYRARGMAVDDFAPNFSFFFSNGLDAEYAVLGRVARRIWAIALRDLYGADERSQKLKYHVQTSGRSLHAQEMAFNDIRTTLQAWMAIQDHCNSLHTNAYDEAVTTPTEESVRRALAIQLVIQKELGLGRAENLLQGSYLIEALTELVEEAVLREFERLSERGGVLGAMESLYQRGRIQDESLHYETLKHSGELPVIGVNTFVSPDAEAAHAMPEQLMRATEEEKARQLENLRAFQARWAAETPGALNALQEAARSGRNVFEALMECTRVASLGQISEALFEVGGRYRRSM